jgi:hypothetical protein
LLPQSFRAGKKHFAFVGKVAEERSLGESGAFGYLGDRRLGETAIAVERKRGSLQP